MNISQLGESPRFKHPQRVPHIIQVNSGVRVPPDKLRLYIYHMLVQSAAEAVPRDVPNLAEGLPLLWGAIRRAEALPDGKSIRFQLDDSAEDSILSKIVNRPVYALAPEIRDLPVRQRPWPSGPSRGFRTFISDEKYAERRPFVQPQDDSEFSGETRKASTAGSTALRVIAALTIFGVVGLVGYSLRD